jgi:hypothetical protein
MLFDYEVISLIFYNWISVAEWADRENLGASLGENSKIGDIKMQLLIFFK